jgi:hypothetical protein
MFFPRAFPSNFLVVAVLIAVPQVILAQEKNAEQGNVRKPKDDADLRYWLENMVWHHNFTRAEISAGIAFWS